MYADDVQMYKSCPLGLIEDCVCVINEDLEKIVSFSERNGLFLNPSKSKCIIISKKPVDSSNYPQISLNGTAIEYVDTAKNLGMVFNRTLTWDTHINAAIGKAYGVLRTLWPTQYYTPLKTRLMLAKTLIIPILIYGCEVYCNCDYNSRRKLNVAYNSIARYIYGLKRYDRISSFSKAIYNLSFDNLIRYKTLVLLFTIMHTHQPCYLFARLQMSSSIRSQQLIQFRSSCLTSERQFFVNAIRLWNCLPRNMKRIGDLRCFRTELKTHLSLH